MLEHLASPGSRRPARASRADGGQISLAVVIFAAGALMVVSLVYYQGLQLRAARHASSIAEESARAGAGQLDRRRAYTTGVAVVDPAAAARHARAYLARSGAAGTVSVTDARRVRVSVTVSEPAPLLSIIGVDSVSVTRSATADLFHRVTGPAR